MAFIGLNPIMDTYVAQYAPEQNLFSNIDNALFISRFQQAGDSFRSLIQFESSQQSTPPVTTLEAAYLLLFLYRNEIPDGTIQINLYGILDPWNEHTVTWNSRPSFANESKSTFILPSGWTGPILVDITKLAERWADGSAPNYGIVIIGDEERNRLVGFWGAKASYHIFRPRLMIKFTGGKE